MKQTAIIVRVGNEEVLVRIVGQHVPPDFIQADERRFGMTWQPVEAEVRNEGDDV